MSMSYIRETYGVPAKRGGRVEYLGTTPPRMGTIVSACDASLRIRLDGDKNAGKYHPTWMLRYFINPPEPQP